MRTFLTAFLLASSVASAASLVPDDGQVYAPPIPGKGSFTLAGTLGQFADNPKLSTNTETVYLRQGSVALFGLTGTTIKPTLYATGIVRGTVASAQAYVWRLPSEGPYDPLNASTAAQVRAETGGIAFLPLSTKETSMGTVTLTETQNIVRPNFDDTACRQIGYIQDSTWSSTAVTASANIMSGGKVWLRSYDANGARASIQTVGIPKGYFVASTTAGFSSANLPGAPVSTTADQLGFIVQSGNNLVLITETGASFVIATGTADAAFPAGGVLALAPEGALSIQLTSTAASLYVPGGWGTDGALCPGQAETAALTVNSVLSNPATLDSTVAVPTALGEAVVTYDLNDPANQFSLAKPFAELVIVNSKLPTSTKYGTPTTTISNLVPISSLAP